MHGANISTQGPDPAATQLGTQHLSRPPAVLPDLPSAARRAAGLRVAALGAAGASAPKPRLVYICANCGAQCMQWAGRCPSCNRPGTVSRDPVPREPPAGAAGAGGASGGGAGMQAMQRIQQGLNGQPATANGQRSMGWVGGGGGDGGGGADASLDAPLSLRALYDKMEAEGFAGRGRIPLSGRTGVEVQRVLGGGVVPGALVLIGGDPGVGKSTLTLQVAAMMAHPEIDFDALEGDVPAPPPAAAAPLPPLGAELEAGFEPGAGAGDGLATAQAAADAVGGAGETMYDQPEEVDEWGVSDPSIASGGSYSYDSGAVQAPAAGAAVREPCTVLYVTAEETREQVVARSRRMGLHLCERVVVLCGCEMEAVIRTVLQVRPQAVVLDSINTVYMRSLASAPGTVNQIRECGQMLLRMAKDNHVAVFIVGHVTKQGDMAGPNTLAHMVDTVLFLEGDVAQSVRLLRVVKNRHGSDAECGVFTMDRNGLHAVANHSALFLESRLMEGGEGAPEEEGASSVVGVTLQGSRAILVEVQALVSPLGERAAASASALSYRSSSGFDRTRLSNLCAILDKAVPTMELSNCSVIVNVVGGGQVKDVATDLPLAVAIASSYFNVAVPRDLAVCGEVDLAGRVRRSFQRLDVRLKEAAKLGFKRVVIPATKDWQRLASDPQLVEAGVQVIAVRSVAEALMAALGPMAIGHRPPNVMPPARGKPPPGTGPPGSRFRRRGGGGGGGGRSGNRGGGGAGSGGGGYDDEPMPPPPNIVTAGDWPRAAAMGGLAAAYAAAASAPPAAGGGMWVGGDNVASGDISGATWGGAGPWAGEQGQAAEWAAQQEWGAPGSAQGEWAGHEQQGQQGWWGQEGGGGDGYWGQAPAQGYGGGWGSGGPAEAAASGDETEPAAPLAALSPSPSPYSPAVAPGAYAPAAPSPFSPAVPPPPPPPAAPTTTPPGAAARQGGDELPAEASLSERRRARRKAGGGGDGSKG
ncbi:hypothetical protein HYH03_008571 [Edaphochlamys debaryana]|uniref:RecA family profile 1 domain-containing protein n=1 Tax=Edaphochlamys debaryana TaxID=47281 RepID=A0A835Y0S6_9CHLO|nr:hypothetical protein HYH03_008571 [Edaphochlamys debaryana]|eukprot:KAG2493147.1 hypothetical protein HYH03_008571 [Edaphochlamys debaryana]